MPTALVRSLLALLLLLAGVTPALAQTTVTLRDGLNGYAGTRDVDPLSSLPDTPRGSVTVLNTNWSTSAILIRFAIFAAEGGPVPDGATITSATLSLYKYEGPTSIYEARRLTKNWQEMEATWNVASTGLPWQTAGAQGASDVAPSADSQATAPTIGWFNLDVTSGVQAFASGTANYGWRVGWVSGTTGAKSFWSRDHQQQIDLRPTLTISYTIGSCGSGTLRPYEGAPVNGNPIAISGSSATTFEAEHFNCGGQDMAYHDNVAGNAGGQFRPAEDVDIIASTDSAGGGFVIQNFYTGEWMTYTIHVAQAGTYDLAIRAANDSSPTGAFHMEIDGANVTGSVVVPVTGSLSTFQWVTKTGVTLAAGQHVLKLASDQQFFHVNQIRFTPTTPSAACNSGSLRPYDGAPVNGSPVAISANSATTFEAEHFNCGGQDVAYHDNVAGNAGGQFRTSEDVDIIASTDSAGGGYVIQNFYTGEWMTYTINVVQGGTYDLAIRAANDSSPTGAFHIEIDGANVTGSVVVPVTGTLSTFQWVTKAGVTLSTGPHVLKLVSDQQFFHVNQLRLTPTTPSAACNSGSLRPYDGAPVNGNPIPIAISGATTIEAEHFNCGGETVAYHDTTTGNAGGQLRTSEDVDIIASTDPTGGGHVVNAMQTGEWLSYTINVQQGGTYDLALRAANAGAGGTAHAEIDGSDVTGAIAITPTGGASSFQWFTKPGVELGAGSHVLKLFVDQQQFDVNQLRLTRVTDPGQEYGPSQGLAAPTRGETRATFHSMSLYLDEIPAGGQQVFVRYRKATQDPAAPGFAWSYGYPLWYDARSANGSCSTACKLPYASALGQQHVRGSVVHLESGTKYLFELGTGTSESNASWRWFVHGTTWTEDPGKAWAETVLQQGAATPIPDASIGCPAAGPCVISAGGSATTGYRVYDGCQTYDDAGRCTVKGEINRGGAGVSLAESSDAAHAIVVNADYVVIRNIRAKSSAIAGIYIKSGRHHVVIEDSEIQDWAWKPGVDQSGWDPVLNPNPNSWSSPGNWGWSGAGGIHLANNNSYVVLQRNLIQAPHWGSFPWDTQVTGYNVQCVAGVGEPNHPHGPNGISVVTGGQQNVIRYNEITGHPTDKKKWYLDGIGGAENFSDRGTPGSDSDIYQNIIEHVFDDGIEGEGGGLNVRIWGNYFSEVKTAIATSTVHFGPLYAWRNVVNHVRICHQQPADEDDDLFSAAFKLAGRKGNGDVWGDGIRYLFHNTLLQDNSAASGSRPNGAGRGIESDGNGLQSARFTIARNNIFHVREDYVGQSTQAWSLDVGNEGSTTPPTGAEFFYNLINGRVTGQLPQGAPNVIRFAGPLTYKPGHGYTSDPWQNGGIGQFQLESGPGRSAGERLRNFSDELGGTTPDIGAHQNGSPAMKFGINAGQ